MKTKLKEIASISAGYQYTRDYKKLIPDPSISLSSLMVVSPDKEKEKENIIDKEEKEVDFKAPIPTLVMQMKDLKLGVSVEWDSLLRTTMEFKKKKPSWLKSNQIIYQPKGQNFGAHYINDAPYRVIAAPQLFVIDVNDSQCRPEFLCWQLNQSPIRKKI